MRRALKLLKRIPGYHQIRHGMLAFMRHNWVIREVAKRILPFRGSMPHRVPQLTAGRGFDRERAAALPIALIVAVGFDEPGMAELVRRVEQAQRLTGGFVPVFVVDTPVFAPIRTRGYAIEHILDRAGWEQFFEPAGWTDYRIDRIGVLWRDYGASQVTMVEHDRIPSVSTLMLLAAQPARHTALEQDNGTGAQRPTDGGGQ